jgi:hypothetical protein
MHDIQLVYKDKIKKERPLKIKVKK